MKLVVIIPCFNEEKTIGKIIKDIPKEVIGVKTIETIVVDDGSTDQTGQVASRAGAFVAPHPTNMGLGLAFKTGIQNALKRGADIIVNIDGDGQFNPTDITILIEPILNDEADFVTASRFIEKSMTPKMKKIKIWGNKRISRIVSLLTGQKFYDVSCGFRAYSRETALKLNLFGKFTYTQETFLDLAYKKMRIKEIPLKVRGTREYGHSKVAQSLFKYAINSSKIILKTFRDYKPLMFFGSISLIFAIFAFGLGVFFIGHYIIERQFSPHVWAGLTSAFTFLIAVLVFVTGLLADMFDRIRTTQEEILYLIKKDLIDKKNGNK